MNTKLKINKKLIATLIAASILALSACDQVKKTEDDVNKGTEHTDTSASTRANEAAITDKLNGYVKVYNWFLKRDEYNNS